MRFTTSIVGPSGRGSDRRPILPGNFVRMDDKETFKIYFENDWDCGGTAKFIYNDGDVLEEHFDAGDILSYPKLFTFKKTEAGGGRLLEVVFRIEEMEDDEPYRFQVMFINNDYDAAGNAINYGDVVANDIVEGRCTNPSLDPDNHLRAFPKYSTDEVDTHPAPPPSKGRLRAV